MTGYQQFLQDIWAQLPVVNTAGYRDGEGNWYGENAKLAGQAAQAAEQYRIMQYNNTFDAGNRIERFFQLNG